MSIQLTTISIRLSAPSVLAVIDVACRVVLLARRHGIEVDARVESPEAFAVVELLGLSDIVVRSDQTSDVSHDYPPSTGR
jgi:hypothetical protein